MRQQVFITRSAHQGQSAQKENARGVLRSSRFNGMEPTFIPLRRIKARKNSKGPWSLGRRYEPRYQPSAPSPHHRPLAQRRQQRINVARLVALRGQ